MSYLTLFFPITSSTWPSQSNPEKLLERTRCRGNRLCVGALLGLVFRSRETVRGAPAGDFVVVDHIGLELGAAVGVLDPLALDLGACHAGNER